MSSLDRFELISKILFRLLMALDLTVMVGLVVWAFLAHPDLMRAIIAKLQAG